MSEPSSTPATPEEPAPTGDATDSLVGTVVAGKYRVDALLGVGGMGAVYRGEHVLMRKPVAVKVLHREMTVMDEVVKRFEREAIVGGRIDHPNVTVATDFGKLDDGAFYLVLEFVPGRSLTSLLEAEGRLPPERALFIARQVAAGLGAAHAAGIVHRDLKPDNVMLIERGGTSDFVKVLDFGIAKVSEEADVPTNTQLTRIGAVFGTPAYMAPEQAAGQPVDARADLYSLGLVIFEMLAGHAAFESDDVVALLSKQLTETPVIPPDVPEDVAEIVRRLLQKEAGARFATAVELIAAIDEVLGPSALPPDSTVLGIPSQRGAGPPTQRTAARPAAAAVTGDVSPRSGGALATLVSGKTLRVAGRDVPVRGVAAAAAALIALVLLLALRGGAGGVAVPALSGVVTRAAEGDRAALEELAARPEAGRSAAEWAAIGKGRAKLSEHRAAVEAFQRALALDASLASDRALLLAVRRAADDEAARKVALDLAAGPLGADGADLLFDVWASTSEKTEATSLAKAMLDRDEVRAHASRSLRLALDLRKARRCEEVKPLLESAKADADERALRPLTNFASRKGCGFLSMNDCYPCLRQDDALNEATKAAQQRKPPQF